MEMFFKQNYPELDGVVITIYKVDIKEEEIKPKIIEEEYPNDVLNIFNLIKNNPSIPKVKIISTTNYSKWYVEKVLTFFVNHKIAIKENNSPHGKWIILKEIKKGDKYIYEIKPN